MSFPSARELGIDRPECIRAVAFDAVGTLITPAPPVAAVYEEIGRRHGSQRTRDVIVGRFHEAFARAETETPQDMAEWDRPDVLRCDEVGERARWRTIVTTVLDDADDPEACFEELFAHFARPEAWRVYAEVEETIEHLTARGYRTAIVSNFDARLLELCRELPGLRDIELPLVSSLVGYRKPSRFFYEALLESLAMPPHEVLVVGDDWENDILGARHAGLQAVYLDRRSERRSEGGTTRTIRSLAELVRSGMLPSCGKSE